MVAVVQRDTRPVQRGDVAHDGQSQAGAGAIDLLRAGRPVERREYPLALGGGNVRGSSGVAHKQAGEGLVSSVELLVQHGLLNSEPGQYLKGAFAHQWARAAQVRR